MNTKEAHEAIFARDAEERAGAGGIVHFTYHELIGEPNGRADYSKSTAGPLAGQVSKDWTLILHYADGSKRISSSERMRGVPALA